MKYQRIKPSGFKARKIEFVAKTQFRCIAMILETFYIAIPLYCKEGRTQTYILENELKYK